MKTVELNRSVTASNDEDAVKLRTELQSKGITLVNLMSSPGAGKTTLLMRLIADLQGSLMIGVVEADLASTVDAERIENAGAKALQVHTGGMCHVDAGMMRKAAEEIGTGDLDLLVLENVGNLICPAEYDTGAHKNVMILSVPEGDDKPFKYPLMFRVSDALVVTKTDALPYFRFDTEALIRRVKALNPAIRIFPVSAKTGEGMEAFETWIVENTFRKA